MSFDWATVITLLITAISVFGGGAYMIKFYALIKALKEFFNELSVAFEDGSVTTEELGKIIIKWHAILSVFKKEETVELKRKLKL